MLRVGYDAQTFLCPNGGLGKGLQLRNLLGRHIESFAGFATTGAQSVWHKAHTRRGFPAPGLATGVTPEAACVDTKSICFSRRKIPRLSSCHRRCASSWFCTTRFRCKASGSAISNPG